MSERTAVIIVMPTRFSDRVYLCCHSVTVAVKQFADSFGTMCQQTSVFVPDNGLELLSGT